MWMFTIKFFQLCFMFQVLLNKILGKRGIGSEGIITAEPQEEVYLGTNALA